MDSMNNKDILENDFSNEQEEKNDLESSLSKKDLTLIKLGKEYRNNYENNKKKIIRNIAGSAIFFFTIGILLSIGLYKFGELPYFVFGIVGTIFATISIIYSYKKKIKKLNDDLEMDDSTLGLKHRFENKYVKGAAKASFKIRLFVTLLFVVLASLVGAMCLGITSMSRLTNKENLVPVNGYLEYAKETSKGISIGIKDNNIEYKTTSYATKYFNELFWNEDELSLGDPITVYIDSTEEIRYNKTKDKDGWAYIYTVIVNDKEYFTYDNYVAGYNSNRQLGLIIGIISLTIAGGNAFGAILSFIIYKKTSKKEYIEV